MGKHISDKLVPIALKSLKDGWHSDGKNLYIFVRGIVEAGYLDMLA